MSVFRKKILGLFNNPNRRKKSTESILPFEKATSVGILYTWTDSKKEEVLEGFIEQIGASKKVDVLCFNPLNTPADTRHSTFDNSALTNFGKLNSTEVQDFIKSSFDYLFHFDFESDEIIKSILVQTNAKCRIGIHDSDNTDYYELMIGINKSAGISNFAEQMIKYVKAIR